ncbi:MAG: phage holin family protein [Acidimicrobiia bacterium]
MASDNPAETIRELKDLVVTYTKQEMLDPLKGMGRYLGFGISGALVLGLGIFFLAMALLRALQTQTGDAFADWRSFLPYLIVVVVLLALAGVCWVAATRKKDRTKELVGVDVE